MNRGCIAIGQVECDGCHRLIEQGRAIFAYGGERR